MSIFIQDLVELRKDSVALRYKISRYCASFVKEQNPEIFILMLLFNKIVKENVISFLNRLHPLPPALIAELKQVLQYTRKRKNEWLVREGEICSYVWYLQKGLARCYYERDEHEVTTWFMQEGNILVLFKSLIRQTESKYNLQAIEDCELYRIRYEDILHVLEKYSEARRIRTMITDKYSNLKDIRIRATSKLTPPERYAYFIRHFPHLLNRITLHHIASYLNISKSSVARARRKKL